MLRPFATALTCNAPSVVDTKAQRKRHVSPSVTNVPATLLAPIGVHERSRTFCFTRTYCSRSFTYYLVQKPTRNVVSRIHPPHYVWRALGLRPYHFHLTHTPKVPQTLTYVPHTLFFTSFLSHLTPFRTHYQQYYDTY